MPLADVCQARLQKPTEQNSLTHTHTYILRCPRQFNDLGKTVDSGGGQ